MLGEAKVGILGASLGAALVGSLALRSLALIPRDWLRRIQGRVAPPIADLAVPVDEERDHVLGPPDAALTLVQYGDYECPYCRSADGVIPVLLERFDGQLRFVPRHFPLPDVHPYAALAAEAVESAAEQGKFWEMHHLLYARQDHLQLADLLRYAQELELDVDAFEAALTDARFADRVAADVEGAESAGVAGTPTFFINDRRYVGAYDAASMEGALLDALRELESSAPAAAITGR
jgi:protein-disulfide isomerase